ncbi:hypothetical protein [Acidiphilium sp.]|uniref:hypothetical protein n=1 Tax=Acidiphilium sp. TaxID=527 RepID=UPI00259053BD|nr:hypothetical protein [Acidiphilium sp.]
MPPDAALPENDRLRMFVGAVLTQAGALVETVAPDLIEVLAPAPVRDALALPELAQLGFGAAPPPGALRVGIESDWLDRFARLLDQRGRTLRLVLCPELRLPAEPERVLGHELALDNATHRLLGVAPAWTRYLLFVFRYAAVSEEKREGLISLGLNLATGALPDAILAGVMPWLDGAEDDAPMPSAEVLPAAWEASRMQDSLARAITPRLEVALAPFLKTLRRRLERDQERLHDYHNDLHREALRREAQLAPDDPARHREGLRRMAIAEEYRAKRDDLARQYALRVSVSWVQTLELVMPVARFTVQLRRRKAERELILDWNPLARRLETPPCAASLSAERPRLVCDEALHLLTQAGLAPCPACGKPFCRACHPAHCPKCHHPAATPLFAEASSVSARP